MLTMQHTREIEGHMARIMAEVQAERAGETDEQAYQRAMRDPEVAEIMNDPVMYVDQSLVWLTIR